MKAFLLLLAGLAVGGAGSVALAREETLALFENRRVSIAVPENFTYASGHDPRGLTTVKITDPGLKVELVVSFLPDPDGRLAKEDDQRAFVADTSLSYARDSVEKDYDFKNLAPRSGTGMYCVFTDSTLVKKLPVPPGDYLKVTTGLKAWPGYFFIFTLLSNDTSSDEYQAAMKLLRQSFEELPPPSGPAV
jgi:hypothetical protein